MNVFGPDTGGFEIKELIGFELKGRLPQEVGQPMSVTNDAGVARLAALASGAVPKRDWRVATAR